MYSVVNNIIVNRSHIINNNADNNVKYFKVAESKS